MLDVRVLNLAGCLMSRRDPNGFMAFGAFMASAPMHTLDRKSVLNNIEA